MRVTVIYLFIWNRWFWWQYLFLLFTKLFTIANLFFNNWFYCPTPHLIVAKVSFWLPDDHPRYCDICDKDTKNLHKIRKIIFGRFSKNEQRALRISKGAFDINTTNLPRTYCRKWRTSIIIMLETLTLYLIWILIRLSGTKSADNSTKCSVGGCQIHLKINDIYHT